VLRAATEPLAQRAGVEMAPSLLFVLLLAPNVMAIWFCATRLKRRLGSIVAMTLIGIAFVLLLSVAYLLRCPFGMRAPGSFCSAMVTNPPWTLLTSVATAPALVLLWLWRTQAKDSELRQAATRLRQTAKELRQAQAGVEAAAVRALREERTKRFTDAIRMLGDTNTAVQLGAVYSLESLAADADEERSRVTETLCAFLRVVSKPPPEPHPGEDEWHQPAVVQSAFTVIGRLPKSTTRIDMRRARLQGMEGDGIDLRGAFLPEADLTSARLDGANFHKADLDRTVLFSALLCGANFIEARLTGANIQRAEMVNAQLTRAILRDADLLGADLTNANLVDADLGRANLKFCNLKSANLRGANLSGSDLSNADLLGVNLDGAHFGDTRYSSKTLFPAGFDASANHLTLVDGFGNPIPMPPKEPPPHSEVPGPTEPELT